MIAHRRVGHHLRRAGVVRLREHPQPDTQCHRGGLHHSGELATADDPDHGKAERNMAA
jgi:hypothetical protein